MEDLLLHYMMRPTKVMAEDLFKISDEQGRISSIMLSESQQIIDNVVAKLRKMEMPVRLLVLKGRQTFASTYFAMDAFKQAYTAEGPFKVSVMGNLYKTTMNIFRMHSVVMQNLDGVFAREVQIKGTPPPSLKFKDTGAFIEGLTAEKKEEGRSGTILYLHGSEVAFYPNPKLFTGLLQSVPNLPGTTIVWETTANGFEQSFQVKWASAVDRVEELCRLHGAKDAVDLLLNKGIWDSDYFPLFIPWYWMKKYRRPPEFERLAKDKLTKIERSIMEAYELDLPQLAWRRYKIREMGGANIYRDDDPKALEFNQEYPCTPEQAFIASGRSVFSSIVVNINLNRTTQLANKGVNRDGKIVRLIVPAEVKWLVRPKYDTYGNVFNKDKVRVKAYKADSNARFFLYKTPQPGKWFNRYVIGADIAEGLAQGDYHVAFVLDRVTFEFVCMYRSRIPYFQMPDVLARLGKYYDNAWILPEANNHGKHVVPELVKIYTNVCQRPHYDYGYEREEEKYGFITSDNSKSVLIGDLDSVITTKPTAIPFVQFWKEAQTFVEDDRGRMGAEGKRKDPSVKNFDDCVMAAGLTVMAHNWAPKPSQDRSEDVPAWAKPDHDEDEGMGAVDTLPAGVDSNKVM